MRIHFDPNGPGVVLAVQWDTAPAISDRPHLEVDSNRSLSYTYGVENLVDRHPVTDSSVFNIGSLTKQFTANKIISLFYQNRLSLSTAVSRFLTGLPPAIAALKISQLLSHCSGIPDHYGFTDTNLVKHATNKDVLEAIRKADTLYFPAGSHYRYSNTAYCLLGMVIEKITGESYEKSMSDSLFRNWPGSFSFLPASATIGTRVHGYEKNNSGNWVEADAPESIFFTTQADGGMLISMKNYMSWCLSLGNDYYYDGLLRKLHSYHPRSPEEFKPHTLVDTSSRLYYGYGWFILPRKSKDGPLIYHTGFNGGFRTSVLLIPELRYRIAIFSASPGVDLEELVHQINVILGVDDKGFIKSGPLES